MESRFIINVKMAMVHLKLYLNMETLPSVLNMNLWWYIIQSSTLSVTGFIYTKYRIKSYIMINVQKLKTEVWSSSVYRLYCDKIILYHKIIVKQNYFLF